MKYWLGLSLVLLGGCEYALSLGKMPEQVTDAGKPEDASVVVQEGGEECLGDTCHTVPVGACGPCNGCCVLNLSCNAGTELLRCGKNAQPCASCNSGEKCINQTCVACGPATCPNGCCDAFGECLVGNLENACGTGGVRCQNCGLSSKKMCFEKSCQACSSANCPDGCCDFFGQCVSGTSDSECGQGGSACRNCGLETCVNQVCQ